MWYIIMQPSHDFNGLYADIDVIPSSTETNDVIMHEE